MNTAALTVLVVDDDFRVAAVHIAYVERISGFRVVGRAHTAADALELARTLHPDLILMDIYLPDGDGLAVMLAILKTPPCPAVIVISAAGDIATVQQALQLGAVHYLIKPFRFAALAERLAAFRDVREHLSGWPEEPTQDDINKIFELMRPAVSSRNIPVEASHLAPTLQLVYDVIAAGDSSLSAGEVATAIGISRATAQRCLSQLEQSRAIKLELRYGNTGRPEHRYSLKQQ